MTELGQIPCRLESETAVCRGTIIRKPGLIVHRRWLVDNWEARRHVVCVVTRNCAPLRKRVFVQCLHAVGIPHEVIQANIMKWTFRDLYRNGDVTAFSAGS